MIYLIRHGQTAWNKSTIFRGQKDIPLDEYGHKQAKLTAKYLKDKNIKYIFSSPLSRAMDTAKYLSDVKGITIKKVEEYKDINFGNWEGKDFDWVRNNDPDTYYLYKNEPERVVFPDGESLNHCFERSFERFYSMVKELQDNIAIVTHRVIIKLLLIGVLHLSLKAFWQLQIDTCSITELYHKDLFFVLRKMNFTCHLDDTDKIKPDF